MRSVGVGHFIGFKKFASKKIRQIRTEKNMLQLPWNISHRCWQKRLHRQAFLICNVFFINVSRGVFLKGPKTFLAQKTLFCAQFLQGKFSFSWLESLQLKFLVGDTRGQACGFLTTAPLDRNLSLRNSCQARNVIGTFEKCTPGNINKKDMHIAEKKNNPDNTFNPYGRQSDKKIWL